MTKRLIKTAEDHAALRKLITGATGATAARPSSPEPGQQYFDTTLGYPIWWNGSAWVDATGTPPA